VWVYHLYRDVWYCFDNVVASFFLESAGAMGFGSGNEIRLFDPDLSTDGGTKFVATWRSRPFATGTPEYTKRALRLTLLGEGDTYPSAAVMKTERRSRTYVFPDANGQSPVLLQTRLTPGRFRFMQLTVHHMGGGKVRFSRLALYANK
jgi:hypothetical protein